MKIIMLFLALICISCTASGASLASNSIICDNPNDLSILKEQGMGGKTSNEIMSRIDNLIGLYSNINKLDTLKAQLATDREDIRNKAYLGGSSGGEVARDNNDMESNSNKLAKYNSFKHDCTINNDTQSVVVVKTYPIEGIVKVNAIVNGLQGEVWAPANAVTQ